MVRVTVPLDRPVDLSFVPSLRCDLRCSFCMYDAGPDNDAVLDLEATRRYNR